MAGITILTATVPAGALPDIAHKVDLLARRCARKGMPAPSLAETGRHFDPDPRARVAPGTPLALRPKIEMVDLALTSPESIELGGWSLLGRVDALPDGSPLVARTPGTEAMPLPMLQSPYACDHCRKPRVRTETFLVFNAAGQVRQVGRNCLRDFLGHDPARLLWWHEAVGTLWGSLGGYAGSGERLWDTDAVLALAARVAAHGGFLGRAKAAEINREIEEQELTRRRHVTSTASEVLWRLDPPPTGSRERRTRAMQIADWDERYPDDAAAQALLAATKAALAALTPADEWQANLAAIAPQARLRERHLGLAVSAVVLGLRTQERAAKAVRPVAPSRHQGEVGERITVPATISFLREFPSDYGTRTLAKFESPDGALLWWASGELFRPDREPAEGWAVGDEVTLTGTVKAHESDHYDGRAVTVLARCILRPASVAVAS